MNMRYKKVLLVWPPTAVNIRTKIHGHPPVGLGYIAQTLTDNGISCDVINMGLEPSRKRLIRKIQKFQPDLIGFSMMTAQYRRSYELIRNVHQQFPEPAIVVGGPHNSIFREAVLEQCEAVDYGVVLEGEQTIVELCSGNPPNQIKGLVYRNNGTVVYNGDRPFIDDLDSLSFPRYSQFGLSKYPVKKIAVATTRGCPFSCTYCPNPLAIGKKFRKRTAENVVEEIVYWYGRGYREIDVLDDNFTLDQQRVFEICRSLIRKNLDGLFLACPNGVRADRATEEMLKVMKRAGFSEIAFGVEAGTNKVLKNLKKGEAIEQIEAAIKYACELDYKVTLFFLIGSPGETLEDFRQSLEIAKRYPIFSANFYNIIPFPGTELFEWIRNKRLFVEQVDEYLNYGDAFANRVFFQTQEMPLEDRRKAVLLANKVSKEILRNYLCRKLKSFGLFAKPLSAFLASDFVQGAYRKSTVVKRILRWIGRFWGIR